MSSINPSWSPTDTAVPATPAQQTNASPGWGPMDTAVPATPAQQQPDPASIVNDVAHAAPATSIARASLAPEVPQQIQRYATSFNQPTSDFRVVDGHIVRGLPESYDTNNQPTKFARTEPSVFNGSTGIGDTMQRAGLWAASGTGQAIPAVTGTASSIAGTLMGGLPGGVAAGVAGAAAGETAREAWDKTLAGEDPTKNYDAWNILGQGALGGSAPVVGAAVGKGLEALGNPFISRLAPDQLQSLVKEMTDKGFVVPPGINANVMGLGNTLQWLGNKFAGKKSIALAQTENADAADTLLRGALGISKDTPLNENTYSQLMATQKAALDQIGQKYQSVPVQLTPNSLNSLQALLTPSTSVGEMPLTAQHLKLAPEATQLVQDTISDLQNGGITPKGAFDTITALRDRASRIFDRADPNPAELDIAHTSKKVANILEDTLDENLGTYAGYPDAVPIMQEARKKMAQIATLRDITNPASQQFDTRSLGNALVNQFQRTGKVPPFTDGIDDVAKFAAAFPKALPSKTLSDVGGRGPNLIRESILPLLAINDPGVAAMVAGQEAIKSPTANWLLGAGSQKALSTPAMQQLIPKSITDATKSALPYVTEPAEQELLDRGKSK